MEVLDERLEVQEVQEVAGMALVPKGPHCLGSGVVAPVVALEESFDCRSLERVRRFLAFPSRQANRHFCPWRRDVFGLVCALSDDGTERCLCCLLVDCSCDSEMREMLDWREITVETDRGRRTSAALTNFGCSSLFVACIASLSVGLTDSF